jgi:hypothetical protein
MQHMIGIRALQQLRTRVWVRIGGQIALLGGIFSHYLKLGYAIPSKLVSPEEKGMKKILEWIGIAFVSLTVLGAAPACADSLTGPQKNAVRSAKQYLSIKGFSRDGLIQQLSSAAGSGYEVADATVAVDILSIDWDKEAVKSAKQYLGIMGFSCKGLIQQLSSSAGDKYTVSQATYGARQAGAC